MLGLLGSRFASAKNSARIAMISAIVLSSASVAPSTASSDGLPVAVPNFFPPNPGDFPTRSQRPEISALAAHIPVRVAPTIALANARRRRLVLPKGRSGRRLRRVIARRRGFATREIHNLAGDGLVFIGRSDAARDLVRVAQSTAAAPDRPWRPFAPRSRIRLGALGGDLLPSAVRRDPSAPRATPPPSPLAKSSAPDLHSHRIMFRASSRCAASASIQILVALGQKCDLTAVFTRDLLPPRLAAGELRLHFVQSRAQPRRFRGPPVGFEQRRR